MMGDQMDRLSAIMAVYLERIEGCFTSPRRIGIVIVAPDDPDHERSIVFGSLLPSDLRSLAKSPLMLDDEEVESGR